ncbi:hypothetical protein U91I_00536 [alpha proteobacterium U9-1i]|nr:hypothetical protein U91I_00536 [alpha proteobacterium U9-1i]
MLAVCVTPASPSWAQSAPTDTASVQQPPSETRRFRGVYVSGWEAQLFVEAGRENEQPHWAAVTPDARASLAQVLPTVSEPGEGFRVLVEFDGRLSPPGRYGHLAVYTHAVLIERVISARLESRPSAFCDAEASGAWRGANNRIYAVTASTTGPTCAQSVVLLVVRDSDGEVVWTDARPAAQVMGLTAPTTRTPMAAALQAWIGYGARGETTTDLPPWPLEREPPTSAGGFEFAPESWIDRETYLEMRARAEPMFCYVQGMESLACLVERWDQLEKVGVQAFAG